MADVLRVPLCVHRPKLKAEKKMARFGRILLVFVFTNRIELVSFRGTGVVIVFWEQVGVSRSSCVLVFFAK